MPKFVPLWTDVSIWVLLVAIVAYGVSVVRHPQRAAAWGKVMRDGPALASSLVLLLCLFITLLDSVHFRLRLPPLAAPVAAGADAGATGTAGVAGGEAVVGASSISSAADAGGSTRTAVAAGVAYEARTRSLLDLVLRDLVDAREATYSRPLAYIGFTKESLVVDGEIRRVAPRLQFGGAHLQDPAMQWLPDLARRAAGGLLAGGLAALVLCALLVAWVARRERVAFAAATRRIFRRELTVPWHVALATLVVLCLLIGPAAALSGPYHLLGTDLTGNDVLFQSLKSIRTAFVIGTLATVATLPLAVGLGLAAGYFGGWVDEVVQYLYTVLSSVPNVLLIAACVLMVQVFLDQNPDLFETGAERADLKLFLLCVVLGATGWAGLCRLLRAETLKLRELEYVQAADAFGISDTRILVRHIFPNVAHLMLIVTVLEFSSLILYEAVLSYVGVGVDPSMNSFGGMINLARSEMSRDPVVWWSFASAFGFMVTLVLAANLFADGVRDAFDPRAKVSRPRRLVVRAAGR